MSDENPSFINVSAATVFAAEGARVGIVACEQCGAAILVDPRDGIDRPLLHAMWHQEQQPPGGGS